MQNAQATMANCMTPPHKQISPTIVIWIMHTDCGGYLNCMSISESYTHYMLAQMRLNVLHKENQQTFDMKIERNFRNWNSNNANVQRKDCFSFMKEKNHHGTQIHSTQYVIFPEGQYIGPLTLTKLCMCALLCPINVTNAVHIFQYFSINNDVLKNVSVPCRNSILNTLIYRFFTRFYF